MALVRRWLAARRQAKRRQDDAVKARHAQAQRARRKRASSPPQTPKKRQVATARGHAANFFHRRQFATGLGAMKHP